LADRVAACTGLPITTPCPFSGDCDDCGGGAVIVLGYWLVISSVALPVTGFVPLFRLVRSGLLAPARWE
jgi:hypothetical protein